jgi:hypothetical protein
MTWFMFLWYQMVSQSQIVSNLLCFNLYFDAKHYHLYKTYFFFPQNSQVQKNDQSVKEWLQSWPKTPSHHGQIHPPLTTYSKIMSLHL